MQDMQDLESFQMLSGTVTSIVFHNETNGYTILNIETDGQEEVTVLGCMPGVCPGESLELQGNWVHHPSYGDQFKAEIISRCMPVGEKAILEYLSSGVIRGVGRATAQAIVDAFGEDALDVIEYQPERLADLPGMSPKRAASISEQFKRQMGMRLLLDFMSEYSVPLRLAMPLYRRFGDKSLAVLQKNPYVLSTTEANGSFFAADSLAAEMGFEPDNPQRVESGTIFELAYNLNNGHTYIPREKLAAATAVLLELEDTGPVETAIEVLTERGEIVREEIMGQDACYLASLHLAETRVAVRLDEMCHMELTPPSNLDAIVAQLEKEQKIHYAAQQKQAVKLAASRQLMLLTGGPGTGKTTCLRAVLSLFDRLGLQTELAAPTGRAAKRLGEACGAPARTIHRLLEAKVDPASGLLNFTRNEREPLKADAVIVDETSMVDIELMAALLGALRSDCRLVLVGDPDQLPSVGPGNLLGNLVHSKRVPAVRLTEIFRQAQESAIVTNAHTINRGMVPDLRANNKDFFFLKRPTAERTAQTVVELCQTRLPKNMGIPIDQIQVLTPTRKRGAGSAALNRAIQAAVNPPAPRKPERVFGDIIFRVGDRVMQTRNDYDAMWYDPATGERDMGVFNGDIGVVTAVDRGEAALVVNFDGRIVEYPADALNDLEPAYAITVHKSQGSEYRAVILAVSDVPSGLLTRGVLYTAITRAKELFILVGDDVLVKKMIENNRHTRRYSGLRARLAAMGGQAPKT